jgi:hypothetical protein
VEWCASTKSMLASLGGVVLRGVDDGRGVMESHRWGSCLVKWWQMMEGLPCMGNVELYPEDWLEVVWS